MNELIQTRQALPSEGYRMLSEAEALSGELAKMLGLVAPITMSADQQALWIVSAVDALQDIRASEVANISAEVRRSVTRHSQIVPKISDLVAEARSRESRIRQASLPPRADNEPLPKRDVMDRRGKPMSEGDTAELNARLAHLGSPKRYRPDGSKYDVSGAA